MWLASEKRVGGLPFFSCVMAFKNNESYGGPFELHLEAYTCFIYHVYHLLSINLFNLIK